jgi:hypothetical protein
MKRSSSSSSLQSLVSYFPQSIPNASKSKRNDASSSLGQLNPILLQNFKLLLHLASPLQQFWLMQVHSSSCFLRPSFCVPHLPESLYLSKPSSTTTAFSITDSISSTAMMLRSSSSSSEQSLVSYLPQSIPNASKSKRNEASSSLGQLNPILLQNFKLLLHLASPLQQFWLMQTHSSSCFARPSF